MKISSIPKSGRKGSVVYLNTRYGKVAREYVRPSNPRTPEQQGHRNNVRAVSGRWRTLTPEQSAAWRMAAANFSLIWIRTCQHIDGWTGVPRVARARIPATAA